jgi:arylsulfatase A-like enzyme
VLADYADRFIRNADAAAPLFLYLSPWAPHAEAVPAPRHATAFSDLAPWRPPSYNEADVSDKPAYIATLPTLDAYKVNRIDTLRRNMYRSLLSVDDTVATVVQALRDTGRLADTMLVFTSDNGFLWGEHRWQARWGKTVPYDESIRVPLLIRYDAMVPAGSTFGGIVGNIDLSATFADLAGATLPGADGLSLVGSFADPTRWPRTDLLIEQLHGWAPNPSYCAIRSKEFMYAQYSTHEEELYPVGSDPHQLVNVASQPAWQDVVAAMRGRVQRLCSPPPPDMSLIAVEHGRAISFKLRKHLFARGTVAVEAGGPAACRENVEIEIQRRKNGDWKPVAVLTTDDSARFKVALADRPGRYRAVTVESQIGSPTTDICHAATSPGRRHRHRG